MGITRFPFNYVLLMFWKSLSRGRKGVILEKRIDCSFLYFSFFFLIRVVLNALNAGFLWNLGENVVALVVYGT